MEDKPLPAHQREDLKWKPGQSGNPSGRPKGARSKLSETFLAEMLVDFEAHGAAAIQKCRETKPDVYVRVIASIVPRELELRRSDYDDLSDDELLRQLERIHAKIAGGGLGNTGGTGAPILIEGSAGIGR